IWAKSVLAVLGPPPRYRPMSTSEEYLAHAEECVRLANLTQDDFLKRHLLSLRQSLLQTAENLREKDAESKLP
ncbi:MAG: hypothetical protein KGL97_01080, partial [Alphaproteobacteria bacterium]|nr:hypothetical protein [Alphaproteobacteria bacterium]